jgi:hypothetical protein
LCLDENGHVQSFGVGRYAKQDEIERFVSTVGEQNLNSFQLTQLRELRGEVVLKENEFTGKKEKGFSVKWERETVGAGWFRNEEGKSVWNAGEKGKYIEVKITFDRTDGVRLDEIFKAMKSLNQDKLNEVFATRECSHFGPRPGVVRICCRGGSYLGTMSEEAYKNYLASDENVMQEEAEQ